MRNYKGKRVDNGELVHGWYMEHPFKDDPTKPLSVIVQDEIPYEVIPESVGQSTGRKDKTETEAFGGDIVKFDDHEYLAEIKYFPEFAAFLFDSHNEETRNSSQILMLWSMDFKIVGNVHTHPELIK